MTSQHSDSPKSVPVESVRTGLQDPSPTSYNETSNHSAKEVPPSDRVLIFDTTLRDGEQSPGASMLLGEKLSIAALLDSMYVDVIEAGFPAASVGDCESVRAIAEAAKNARICALARAERSDIESAAEALKPAHAARIHSFISTSPLHMKYKLQLQPEQVLEKIISSVKLARNYCDDVEWSPEDGTRSEIDFLCRCIEAAIANGASTINVPDTVGYSVPEQFGELISTLRERIPNSDKAIFSVHCHNDLGLAVANSLAGVNAGARQVECTINGIGERAGNASLEEVVMALRTRQDAYPFDVKVENKKLVAASRLVSSCTGFFVQHNKAIVGKNAFAHEAGIHQDGMLKHSSTYEIMTPESVGWVHSSLVLGKHSGRAALRRKMEDLGFTNIDSADLTNLFRKFKALADRKKVVYDNDLIAMLEGEAAEDSGGASLVSLHVVAGTSGPQRANVVLVVDGIECSAESTGQGPVDALFNAICKILPHKGELQLYQVQAVTQGTDAQAEISVQLAIGDKIVTGHAADVDTLVASAMAYVSAVNKLASASSEAENVAATSV